MDAQILAFMHRKTRRKCCEISERSRQVQLWSHFINGHQSRNNLWIAGSEQPESQHHRISARDCRRGQLRRFIGNPHLSRINGSRTREHKNLHHQQLHNQIRHNIDFHPAIRALATGVRRSLLRGTRTGNTVILELHHQRSTKNNTIREILIHLGVAVPVIIISHFLGQLIFTIFA